MTKRAESMLAIRKEDFEFLMHHFSCCSQLRDNEKVTVKNIRTAVYSKAQRSKTCQKRLKTAEDFLSCVGNWRSAQLRIVMDRERYGEMIRAFIQSPAITNGSYNVRQSTCRNLLDLGVHLANLVACSTKALMSQRSLTHFQSLVFLSYCVYLQKKGASEESIHAILKVIKAGDEKKQKRLLVQAAQINTMIAKLGNTGWNIVRATELFFICPLSVYNLLNLSSNELGEILSSLSAVSPDFSGSLIPSYTIPGLIECFIRQSGILEHDSIKTIGNCLGYDPHTMPETSDHIDQVYTEALPSFNCYEKSLVHSTVKSNPRGSEHSTEKSIVLFNNGEMVADRIQQTPSISQTLNIVHEDASALIHQPRKRQRPEHETGEAGNMKYRLTSHRTNPRTIDRSSSHRNLGLSSNSLGISTQSLISTPVALQSSQCTASDISSYNTFEPLQLESLEESRLEQRSRQGAELVSTVSIECFTRASRPQHTERHMENFRPQIQPCALAVVSDTAQSIWFAIKGDIKGLQYLFAHRLASPRDVSHTRRYTLVRWALYGGMHNYATVQFLLNQGASVDEESYQHVWDYAYRRKCSQKELSELRCIMAHPPTSYIHTDWCDQQQFPRIHQIVLGRCSEPLSSEITNNPDAVRLTDATNRTALDWATALAKLSDMKLLIDCGSPRDTMDVNGRTTVLHAVDSHSDDALRMVLEAGANANPELPENLFRSTPLISASFGGLVGMMKLLLEHGANVDACNPEGRTALHTVASMHNVECAKILVDYGADIGYINSNGHSPVMTAVVCNNHAVLQFFIAQNETYRLERSISLPIIAKSADKQTMAILAASDLLQGSPDEDNLAAAWEILQSRTDCDEALSDAFTSLCRGQ